MKNKNNLMSTSPDRLTRFLTLAIFGVVALLLFGLAYSSVLAGSSIL